MRITALQTDILWGDRPANASQAMELLSGATGSDLYVLPEMWSTGFATNPIGMAECDSYSLDWMKSTAKETGAALCGTVAIVTEEDGQRCYRNRCYFVKPDGSVSTYDKRHLFSYGGEHHNYTAGDTRTVVEWCGMRWLLQTCYDLRFPVWSRYRGDYDGIIYMANWPEARIGVWQLLLRARAIENQAIVVGVNRVGRDPYCYYPGRSAIIDAKGRTLCQSTHAIAEALTAEVQLSDIVRFREKFRVLDDRDK